jgi:PAS domain S-box-containing protein
VIEPFTPASCAEATFENDQLFFSITDQEGTILSGNEVFVRISGYEKSELIGEPHNIIRHPDMPKIVFKTLWDHLKAEKAVIAYVKNRAKGGEFYWVLAAVFPLGDRYVSIRVKPNSPLFPTLRELYAKLLMAESAGGVESSEALLQEHLGVLGFGGYDHFMADALLRELNERRKILVKAPVDKEGCWSEENPLDHTLTLLRERAHEVMERYDEWFDKIDSYQQIKSLFEEKGSTLRHLARDIVFLSLNASVASYKVASGGETFGVLSHDVRLNAKENDALIGDIHTLTGSLSQQLNEYIFAVSVSRIQIEMIHYFIYETHGCEVESMVELGENFEILISLLIRYAQKLRTLQLQMESTIQEILGKLSRLERQVMYLGYIQVYGIIEAAGNTDETIDFGEIFSQLKTLIHKTSGEIESMEKTGARFQHENHRLLVQAETMAASLDQLRSDADTIKLVEKGYDERR